MLSEYGSDGTDRARFGGPIAPRVTIVPCVPIASSLFQVVSLGSAGNAETGARNGTICQVTPQTLPTTLPFAWTCHREALRGNVVGRGAPTGP